MTKIILRILLIICLLPFAACSFGIMSIPVGIMKMAQAHAQNANTVTIPNLPPAQLPLLGNELAAIWQNNKTVNVPFSVFPPLSSFLQWVNPQQSGAKCNGVTDDKIAMATFFATVNNGTTGYIPPNSNCLYSTSQVVPNGGTLIGSKNSTLTFTGTGNGLTFGPSTGTAPNVTLVRDINFTAGTAQASGYLLKLQNSLAANEAVSIFDDVLVTYSGYNIYNGIGLFNAGNFVGDALMVNGVINDGLDIWNTGAIGSGAGQIVDRSSFINSHLGMNIGGNVAGFYVLHSSFGNNDQNALIGQSLATGTNLQLTFYDNFFDVAKSGLSLSGVELAYSGSTIQDLIVFNNNWFSIGALGGNGCELQVDSAYVGYIYGLNGHYTNGADGVCNLSATAHEYWTNNHFVEALTTAVNDTANDPNLYVQNNIVAPGVGSYAGTVNAFPSIQGLNVSQPTSGTPITCASINLNAGLWLCIGSVFANPASGTVITHEAGALSLTAATVPANSGADTNGCQVGGTGANNALSCSMPFSAITGPTTLYLNANALFSVSTLSQYCTIRCRPYPF